MMAVGQVLTAALEALDLSIGVFAIPVDGYRHASLRRYRCDSSSIVLIITSIEDSRSKCPCGGPE